MFYAILAESPPVFLVQPNEQLDASQAAVLLERLTGRFMHAVAVVAWDQAGAFKNFGHPVSEAAATDEDLQWREFELPPEPELPF